MISHRTLLLALVACFFSVEINSQLYPNALSWRMSTAYNNYLLREVYRQYEERQTQIEEAYRSENSIKAYRDDCISRYKKIAGSFPDKTYLDARIAGESQQEGFRIEKIIFESIPGRFVTANLYLPEGEGPFPVALELCGHGLGGKIPSPRAAILMALNEIAVLVVDPIGQGERIQFVNEENQSLTRGATTEHTLLNTGANLLGSSLAAYEYWDNHRAIDYLVTRPDIDDERIGVFGSSGGGTQTAYMLGLDERIKVASVCSYFTKREKVLEIYGPSDGCQHIPYEGREYLEIADFVLMMAPKPVLIMSGKYDFVDYWGALKGFDELKKTYRALGSPEKVGMVSVENGHGMPKAKREALVTWFRRWMYGDTTAVRETREIRIPREDLLCTETGQVLTAIPENISIPQYHREKYRDLQDSRNEFLKEDDDRIEEKVIELLGLEYPSESVTAEKTGSFSFRNYDVFKYQLTRPGQFPVPCIVLYPENANPESDIVLYLDEDGKSKVFSDDVTTGEYINQNQILILADLRGYGETEDPASLNDTKYWNREYRNAMTSMHIGKPIMGQRVIDIMSILDFAGLEDMLKGRTVNIVSRGSYGPVVVHAAFLDKRIHNALISGSIKSFYEYLENPMQRDVYTNVLYGVLKYYDLDDLARKAGDTRVRFVD